MIDNIKKGCSYCTPVNIDVKHGCAIFDPPLNTVDEEILAYIDISRAYLTIEVYDLCDERYIFQKVNDNVGIYIAYCPFCGRRLN